MSRYTLHIVDDELLAIEGIQHLLTKHPEFKVTHVAHTVKDEIKALDAEVPDLLLLDIQLGNRSGFEILEHLQNEHLTIPRIIFTTAYDQFAVRAFELGSVDYLTKPFRAERFSQALARFIQRHTQPGEKTAPPILIKIEGQHLLVQRKDIVCIQAQGDYTEFKTRDQKTLGLVHQTLTHWEKMLGTN